MRVLHFSAEPEGEADLKLSAELRGIADALLPGRVRKDTSLDVVPQARPSDVSTYVYNIQPNIVQFSSHGEASGLQLCDAFFDPVEFKPSELRAALQDQNVKLLVLNCCASWHLAEWVLGRRIPERKSEDEAEDSDVIPARRIGRKRVDEKDRLKERDERPAVVDVVIFTEGKLPDDQAHVFAETLYRSLQAGLPIDRAFRIAIGDLSEFGRGLYRCEANDDAAKKIVLLDQSDGPDSDARTAQAADAQRRTLAGSNRLAEIRAGVARDVRFNGIILGLTILAALVASVVYGSVADWSDAKICCLKVATMFGWLKLDPWLIFTFFAAPPLIYLVEHYWLKRPLAEAEAAAFWLAVSPPESEDPVSLADRVEALVAELDGARKNLVGEKKNG